VLNREIWVASTLIELQDFGTDDSGADAYSRLLVARLAELLSPGEVGLMLVDTPDHLESAAASTARAGDLSSLEKRYGGVCAECQRTGFPIVDRSLEAGEPVDYLSAFPLSRADEVLGVAAVLHQDKLEHASARLAEVLTEAAGIAMSQRRDLRRALTRADQLQGALDSRVVIEQAKGAMAARLGVTPSAAFELLRSFARRNNLKLTDVCAAVIDGRLTSELL
jgi:hypothetical protein